MGGVSPAAAALWGLTAAAAGCIVRAVMPDSRPKGRDTAPLPAESPDELAPDIVQLLAQLPDDDGQVRVYKLRPGGPDSREAWERIGKFPAVELDPDAIAERHGAGTYRFFIHAGAAHQHQLIRTATETWASRAIPAAAQAPAALSAVDAGYRDLLTMLQTQAAAAAANSQALMTAVLSSIQQGGNGFKAADLLEAIRLGRESATPPGPVDPLASLSAVVSAARDLAGLPPPSSGEGEGDVLSAAIPKVLDIIGAAIARPRATGEAVPPAPRAAALPGGGAATLPPPPAPAAGGNGVNPLEEYARMIVRDAQAGRDGYTWGVWAIERAPEDLAPHLREFSELSQDRRAEWIEKFAPQLFPYLDFVNDAAEGIREYFSPPPAEEGDTGGDAGAEPVHTGTSAPR